ncbi:MAG: polyribonucleotide nucleotidyltransferase, partial [Phycisphaerae bacterium]|nr:polyribonucleotide nucleotidyltransferase [Phycisphaerae bacterium]
MSNVVRVEKQVGTKVISIETGKIARQAGAAVVVTCGDTMVLVAATSAPPRENIDYFPLSVDYREKLSAAGKFPGGFMKREGRPSTKEILTARMIDRPLRPLFPEGYFNEVQVMVTVISADQEHDPDILSMIGASAALSISTVPFQGPIGAVRLGRVDGQFVINPTHDEREKSDYNLILAGRRDAINMIEVDAKQIAEDIVAAGIELAHQSIVQICDLIDELVAKCGKEKQPVEIEWNQQVADEIVAKYTDEYAKAFQIVSKADRNAAVKAITEKLAEVYCVPEEGAKEARCSKVLLGRIIDSIQSKIVRKLTLEGKRLDGRGFEEIRPVSCEV